MALDTVKADFQVESPLALDPGDERVRGRREDSDAAVAGVVPGASRSGAAA